MAAPPDGAPPGMEFALHHPPAEPGSGKHAIGTTAPARRFAGQKADLLPAEKIEFGKALSHLGEYIHLSAHPPAHPPIHRGIYPSAHQDPSSMAMHMATAPTFTYPWPGHIDENETGAATE